jgi:ATP-binding cassette subfamily F protein uup
MEAPNILLLDEPTNDLDIPTLAALEEYLDTFPGVLIAVSHDRWFLDRTVDHIICFEGEGKMRTYPGDYSAYLEVRKREDAEAGKQTASKTARSIQKKKKSPNTSKRSSGKLSFGEKKELVETEVRIESAEARKEEIESLLSQNSSDFEAISSLSSELHELTSRLDRDMERWAELAERS